MNAPRQTYTDEATICRHLNLQKERLAELVKKGIIKYDGKKKGYQITNATHAYIGYLKKQVEESHQARNRRTVGEIAGLLMVTEKWIQRLCTEKGMKKLDRGVYDLVEVVQWRIRDLQKEIDTLKAGGEDAIKAKERITVIEMKMKEIELANEEGKVIYIDDIKKIFEPVFAAIRSIILGLERQAAQILGKEAATWIGEHSRKALDELSQLQIKPYAGEKNDRQ